MIYAIIVFVIVQLADIYTTLKGLRGGAVEGNPFVKWMMDKFGGNWIYLKFIGAICIVAYLYTINSVIPVWIISAITFIVVLNNIRIIRKR